MAQSLYISVLLLFIVGNSICQTVNPGISAFVTTDGIKQVAYLVDPIVTESIESLEPIQLPDQYHEDFVLTLNVSGISLFDTRHTNLSVDVIPNTGLRMTLFGLQAKLAYNVSYSFLISSLGSHFSATALLNDSTIAIDFAITSNSNGQLQASVSEIQITIGYLDPGFSGVSEVVADVLSPLIRYLIDELVPGTVTPLINQDISSLLNNMTMSIFLDANNSTIFDYSIVTGPSFTSEGVSVGVKGDAYAVKVRNECPYVSQSVSDSYTAALRAYVTETVFDCVALAYEESGALNTLLNGLLHQNLPFDNRMDMDVNVTASDIVISNWGVSASVVIDLVFEKLLPSYEKFITVSFNASTSIELGLSTSGIDVSVVGNIGNVSTIISVLQVAEDFPQVYVQEIANTNFTALAAQADAFVATTVLPGVNQQLASGILLPQNITQFFQNPQLAFHNQYIAFFTNLAAPTY